MYGELERQFKNKQRNKTHVINFPMLGKKQSYSTII